MDLIKAKQMLEYLDKHDTEALETKRQSQKQRYDKHKSRLYAWKYRNKKKYLKHKFELKKHDISFEAWMKACKIVYLYRQIDNNQI